MPYLRIFLRWRRLALRKLSFPLTSLIFLILLTLVSCGESKTSQCSKLIAEINRGQEAYKKSTSELQNLSEFNPTNPEELKAQMTKKKNSLEPFVREIRGVNQNIKVLALEDHRLQQLRNSYAAQREAIANGFDDSGKAMSSVIAIKLTATDVFKQVENSTKQMGASIETVSRADRESSRIVGEIITYCGNEN